MPSKSALKTRLAGSDSLDRDGAIAHSRAAAENRATMLLSPCGLAKKLRAVCTTAVGSSSVCISSTTRTDGPQQVAMESFYKEFFL